MNRTIYCRETYRILADGHAKAGKAGDDIVCAGMTTLMATAMQAMDGEDIRFTLETDNGRMDLQGHPKTGQAGTCRVILDTVAAGIRMIAKAHPENVSYEQFRMEDD